MRTLNELQEFYLKTLRSDLGVLEKWRKKIVTKLVCIGIPSILVVAAFFIFLLWNESDPQQVLIVLIPVLLINYVAYRLLTRKYIADFKGKVVERIIRFVDENLQYRRDGCVSEAEFKTSKIFRRRIDRYRGDDLVWGRIGKTDVMFSEIHAEYKTESTDSKGKKQTHWHTIFKGLFYMADFNKHIRGETIVLPDTAERLFGRLGKKFQSLSKSRGQLIHLEDPEFEKYFVVYGDDQIQARYILSTSLMKRIVDFKKKTDREIYLSFLGTKVNIAVSFKKNLFEPRVFKTLLDFDMVREYFEDLTLAYGIVEDLNLNRRIWSKR